MATQFKIRPAEQRDEGFIASGFVGTCRLAIPKRHKARMPPGAVSAHFFGVVGHLLKTCEVSVAVTAEDDGRLFGFSIVERPKTIHMVYVSKSHWRIGLGRALMRGIGWSEMVFRIWPNTMPGSGLTWFEDMMEQSGASFVPYFIQAQQTDTKEASTLAKAASEWERLDAERRRREHMEGRANG